MINFFNQNEQDFSRLAKMAEEDQKLWRIKLGNLTATDTFEIYSEGDFRPAAEADVNLERQKEYVGLMKKTGVAVLFKENISPNQTGVFLSKTEKTFSLGHHSEKGFLFMRGKITENIFESLNYKNQNENYRPPILDFRAIKKDWFLYYRSE